MLVVGLLGGSLICLLLINTILDTGSYQITQLQQENVTLTQREQALYEQVAKEESLSALARQARKLGMVQQPLTHFLDLPKRKIANQPVIDPGVPVVPGYVP